SRAIWTSIGVGLLVQVMALLLARSFGRERMLIGWGIGAVLRLVVLLAYGWAMVPMLGLPLAPAMLSLAAVFFVTTLVEPFWLAIASVLCLITLLMAARAHRRTAVSGKAPRGFSNGVEALVLYLRNEVILPNVGAHGDRYVPFILTLFFFILFANLCGLIPYG